MVVTSISDEPDEQQSWTREFLQSAIVLDDQAYSVSGAKVGTLEEPPNGPGRRALSEEAREAVEPKVGHQERDLDIQGLTDSFADFGIVCGVLCPKTDDSGAEAARLLRTASRADIVILDWQIYGDDGKSAFGIISELALAEVSQNALKLICVYTADITNINQIISKIAAGLGKLVSAEHVSKRSDYEIHVGALRIVLYSKVRLDIPDAELASRYAAEAELPTRLLAEFESMTGGLLQRVAIRALAALRKNTHLLAGRFSPNLDAGYLWHRGALLRPADAEDHIRDILASEFESILDASDAMDAANGKECERAIGTLSEPLKDRFKIDRAVVLDDITSLLAPQGELGEVSRLIRNKLKKAPPVADIAAFAVDVAHAVLANEQFAMIMTLRSRYDEIPRQLHLGTVLSSNADGKTRYCICLQPLCDSARILGARQFPLLPISRATNGIFNLVAPVSSEENGHFLVQYNPYLLEMIEFSVRGSISGPVCANKKEHKWIFTDVAGREYVWLAELRTSIAHRIAQKVSNQFGRIGLDIPEWIREKD